MKRSNASSFSLPQNPNVQSPRFEELSVLLPDYIEHPLLKQLAQRLQDDILQKAKQQNANEYNQAENDYQLGDIGKTQALLNMLLTTPVADASVLVVITNETKPKLLLTRRAAHLNSHAGEVSFAGGKHDEDDGNNIVTALREACEETALPPNEVHIIGQLPIQTSKFGLSVRPIVALVKPPITYVPELGEIARIFWADFETLISAPTTDYILAYEMDGNSINIRTPSWVIDNEVVWGLTGRVIASLLKVGFDREIEWYYEATD